MSHRTAPVFNNDRSVWFSPPNQTSVSTTSSPSFRTSRPRFGDLTNSLSLHSSLSSIPPEEACEKLFQALDHARFDQVRRAVASNSDCLRSNRTPFLPPLPSTNHNNSLNPIEYALHNCRLWAALHDHCRRTGGGPVLTNIPGDLTFRSRLTIIPHILCFLISHPDAPRPSYKNLHDALTCDLGDVVALILKKRPELACVPDNRGKTPLHLATALAPRTNSTRVTSYVHLLASHGADVRAKDTLKRTPLHDLVDSLRLPPAIQGLSRRNRSDRSLAEYASVIDALLQHGADLYAEDNHHRTPVSAAFFSLGEYSVLAERSHNIKTAICDTNFAKRLRNVNPSPKIIGPWGLLPEEVVMKILSNLSPKEVVTGIGATCKGLRRVAVHPCSWSHMDKEYCIIHVRQVAAASQQRE